jgi:hypothetical protein
MNIKLFEIVIINSFLVILCLNGKFPLAFIAPNSEMLEIQNL